MYLISSSKDIACVNCQYDGYRTIAPLVWPLDSSLILTIDHQMPIRKYVGFFISCKIIRLPDHVYGYALSSFCCRCYNCGDFANHIAAKCPQGPLPKRCHSCKSTDHLIADCPDRPEPNHHPINGHDNSDEHHAERAPSSSSNSSTPPPPRVSPSPKTAATMQYSPDSPVWRFIRSVIGRWNRV